MRLQLNLYYLTILGELPLGLNNGNGLIIEKYITKILSSPINPFQPVILIFISDYFQNTNTNSCFPQEGCITEVFYIKIGDQHKSKKNV